MNRDILWAKKLTMNGGSWLPLTIHMSDALYVAEILWDSWVSPLVKDCIIDALGEGIDARTFYKFLACAHDLGKACPAFQYKPSHVYAPELDRLLEHRLLESGYSRPRLNADSFKISHGYVTHLILQRHGVSDTVAVVLGGHHGTPPDKAYLNRLKISEAAVIGFIKSSDWEEIQDELYNLAVDMTGITEDWLQTIKLAQTAQVLLSGLVVLADWISSDMRLFPLFPLEKYTTDRSTRVQYALEQLRVPLLWNTQLTDLYERRFGITQPYTIQKVLFETVAQIEHPGLIIVEAPMGGGKTEAALIAAEVLAKRCGCRGIYFALPTQATSNVMFTRVLKWLKTFDSIEKGVSYSVRLSHGRAEFNDEYTDLKLEAVPNETEEDTATNLLVYDWLQGPKKGILSDFVVGTIDQVLLAGLKQRYLCLRHLGLANKVVVIDECHAYDYYMGAYLQKVLQWLGMYRVPVVVLSATLPKKRRQELVQAYMNVKQEENELETISYPQITYTSGKSVQIKTIPSMEVTLDVMIKKLGVGEITKQLKEVLSEGGYAGIIVNTVKRAQEVYEELCRQFDSSIVTLVHASYVQVDRAEREDIVIQELGKANLNRKGTRIVVGTQIFEQSMDIDFDVLITELCPMDLLLQRIGRMHRHNRPSRPKKVKEPICYVMHAELGDFDKDSMLIYDEYLLARTCVVLPQVIQLPKDIPLLVEKVYGEEKILIPEQYFSWYEQALLKSKKRQEEKLARANGVVQIEQPRKGALLGWVSHGQCKIMDATVRGCIESIEVIVVQKRQYGFYLLPWVSQGEQIPVEKLNDTVAKLVASCCMRLPYRFSVQGETVVNELQTKMQTFGLHTTWGASNWLKDALFLILDDSLQTVLCGYQLSYDQSLGLIYTKI